MKNKSKHIHYFHLLIYEQKKLILKRHKSISFMSISIFNTFTDSCQFWNLIPQKIPTYQQKYTTYQQ